MYNVHIYIHIIIYVYTYIMYKLYIYINYHLYINFKSAVLCYPHFQRKLVNRKKKENPESIISGHLKV